MTVSTTTQRIDYAGNGITVAFSVPFPFLEDSYLVVLRTENSTGATTTLTLDSPGVNGYTVSGAGAANGTVTVVTAPSSVQSLTIYRNVPVTQEADFVSNDPLPSELIESSLDKLTLICQDLEEITSRAIVLPPQTSGVSTILPAPEALSLIGWNSDNTGLENYDPSTFGIVIGAGATYTSGVSAGQTDVAFSLPAVFTISDVFYNGVFQDPSAYSISGATITFSEALPADGTVSIHAAVVAPTAIGTSAEINYTPAGVGGTTRTVKSRLDDVVSVANFALAEQAVAEAAGIDGMVYWPAGDWAVPGSIDGLHSVRHVGPGVIVRGADRFAPDPGDAATNILYVDPAGNDANDGLTAALPFATIQAALNALALYGPALRGTWTVKLAAGTYTDGALFPTGLRSRGNVTIQGPDVGGTPNVPTAIIDGTSSVYRRGLAGTTGLRVLIKDIKVQNFAATDEAGIEFSHYCRVRLENVHADTCFYGWHFLDWTYYDALGGIIQGCDTGIQELFGVVRNFRPAAGDANRTLIQNCTNYGIKAKEFCTGHLDYAKIDNCNNGVFLTRCSTANLTDCDIYNNTIGAVCTSGASIVDVATTDWGAGTGDANTVKFLMRGASSNVSRNGGENVPAAPYIGLTEKKVGFDNAVVAHTGTAVRTTIYAAIASFVAGDFQAAGGHIRARIYGAATTLAGTCIVELRNAGANVGTVTLPVGANGGFIVDVNLYNTSGGDNQQHFSEARINGVAPVVAAATRTIAFSSAAQVLQVTATLSNSADTVTFRGAEIYTTEA